MKKTVIAITIITLILGMIYFIPSYKNNSKVIEVSKQFVEALIAGNYENAENLSLGEVKFNISTNKNNKFDSNIIDIDCSVQEANNNTAISNVIAEYMVNGEINLTALKLYMLHNEENKYMVYKIEEINPIIKTSLKKFNSDEITDIENCFKEYVQGIADKDYSGSAKYLVGKAKAAHNATSDIIKNAAFVVGPKDYSFKYLNGNSQNVQIMVEYTNNNRKVVSIISCYKTMEGWKIYDISQI